MGKVVFPFISCRLGRCTAQSLGTSSWCIPQHKLTWNAAAKPFNFCNEQSQRQSHARWPLAPQVFKPTFFVFTVWNSWASVCLWLTSATQWSWWGFTCLSSSAVDSPTIWSQVNSLFPLKSLHKSHFYLPLFDAVLSKPLEPFDLLYVLSYTFIVSVIRRHFVWKASIWSQYYSDFYYYQELLLLENLICAALGLNSQTLRFDWEECCRSRAAKVLKHTHQSQLLCAELYNMQDWPLKSINLNQYFSPICCPSFRVLSPTISSYYCDYPTVLYLPAPFIVFPQSKLSMPLLPFLSLCSPWLLYLMGRLQPRLLCPAVDGIHPVEMSLHSAF